MALSSSQSLIFPLEIFHLILKDLSRSKLRNDEIVLNANDLRRCSLVCRAWASICQAYLFKFATVDSGCLSNSSPGKRIFQAIAAHPKIASYVQNIRYNTTVPVGFQPGQIPDQNVSTLLTLPNLRSIFISVSAPSTSASPKFDDLCAGDFVLFRLWAAYISSASLVDLTLESIEDLPLTILLSCPNLKSLTLTYGSCVDLQPQQVSTTSVLRTSKIESLKVSGVENLPYAFLGFLPHLQKLSVCSVTWRIPAKSRDQLISTFQGLRELTFDYGWDDPENAHLWIYFPLSVAAEMGVKLFEHLQDLTVTPLSEKEAEEIYQALRHAPTIRYFCVTFFKSSLIPYLNLHQFLPQSVGSLKTLQFVFQIEDCIDELPECHDAMEVISEALSLVNSPASLQELMMSIEIGSTQLLSLFGLIRQLKMLDTALFVDSSMFPLLRWITISIRVIHYGPPYTSPNADVRMQADLYEYIESAFQAFRRSSSNSRINFNLIPPRVKPDN